MTEPGSLQAQAKAVRHPAFISYSHADKVFARRLHSRLEAYKLPKPLLAAGEDARIGRLYIDHAELGAVSDLPAAIEQALAASDCLVVVVSPASLQSQWVRAEVRAFRALHPNAPVLCIAAPGHGGLAADLLFAGTPQDDALIAMPRVPLVVNTDEGFDGALLAVIAKLRGRGLEELRNREQKRQRRVRRIWTSAVSSVSAVILALGLLSFAAAIKANSEKNRALAGQSELLATQSSDALRAGDATLATRLALAALPADGRDRPYAWQASVALSRSAQQLRERTQARYPGEKIVLFVPSVQQEGWSYALSRTGKIHIEGPGGASQTIALDLAKPEIDAAYYAGRHAMVMALGGKQIVVWNESTRTQAVKAFTDAPNCMTMSPDGDTVAVTLGGKVEILQLPDLSTLHELPLAQGLIGECSAYSKARGKALVVTMERGETHQVDLVDIKSASRVRVGAIGDLALNVTLDPTGQTGVIAVGNNSIAVVDLATAKLRLASAAESPTLSLPATVAHDASGQRILVGDVAGRVHMFDAASLQRTTVFAEHTDTVASIHVDKDLIYTAGHDGVAKSWSFDPLFQRRALQSQPGITHASVSSASGRYIAATGRDGTVLTWDLSNPGGKPATARPCTGYIRSVVISDGLVTAAAGCETGEVFTWKLDTGALMLQHKADGAILELKYSPDGMLLFAAGDGSFGVIGPDGRVVNSASPRGATGIASIPGTSQVLVVDGQGDAIVHDPKANRLVRALKAPGRSYPKNQNLLHGVVTDTGRYAAVSGSDDRLRIWDLTGGKLVADFKMSRANSGGLAAGPNDQIAFIEEGKVNVWSPALVEPLELKKTFPAAEVAFLPGQPGRIATTLRAEGQWQVWLWDIQSGTSYALMEPGRNKETPTFNRLVLCGPNKSLVAISAHQGPVLAPVLPYTPDLIAAVKKQSPSVARALAREDLKRFFLPMESILDDRPAPTFGYAPLENLVDKTLGWIARLEPADAPKQ